MDSQDPGHGQSVRVLPPPQIGSVITSLKLRELGLFENASQLTLQRTGSGDFYSRSTRQLLIARANKIQSSPNAIFKKNKCPPNKKPPIHRYDTLAPDLPVGLYTGNISEAARDPVWHFNSAGLLEFIDPTTRTVTLRPSIRGKSIAGNQIYLVDSYIFLHINSGYHCFEYDFSRGNIRRRYILPNIPRPWKDVATWVPRIEINPQKPNHSAKPTLYALSDNSKELTSWDLDTGAQFQHIVLHDKIKYSEMFASEKFIYLEGIRSNVKACSAGQRIYEGILADVQDISNTVRFGIERSALPFKTKTDNYLTNCKVEVVNDLLVFGYTNKLKIADLFSTLDLEQTKILKNQGLRADDFVPLSNVISSVPKIVYETTTRNSYFEISHVAYPPHTITHETSSKKLIRDTLSGIEVKNHVILDSCLDAVQDDFEEPTLHFHPDESSRVVLCAGNKLTIFRLVRTINSESKGPSQLEEEFSCVFVGDGRLELTLNSTPVSSRKQLNLCHGHSVLHRQSSESTRNYPTRSVMGPKTNTPNPNWFHHVPYIKYEYAAHINSLIVMEVNKASESLIFHIFDNNNWDHLLSLYPQRLALKSFHDIEITDLTFEVLDEVIIVRRNQTGSKILSEIYLIPVL